MINYVKIIKEIKKLDIEKEKKNKFLKEAILTEICNAPIELLKIPFKLIFILTLGILKVFELLENGLDIVLSIVCTPMMKIIDFIDEKIPRFYFGDKEEHQKLVEMIKKNNIKKI